MTEIMTTTVFSTSLVLLLSVLPMMTAYHPDNETAIKKQIFTDYDNSVKPPSPTRFKLHFFLFAINELSIDKQEMSMTANVFLFWEDFRLAWDPRLYGGLRTLMVQYGKIWQPHLVVENSVDVMRPIGDEEKPPVRLTYNTFISWMVPVNLRVFCKMSILAFPFDTQVCILKIYMWGYFDREVTIDYYKSDLTTFFYVENGEWDLIGSQQISENITGPQFYSKVQIMLKFRRKWVFLGLTLIVPAVLNSLLMSAVFALPFESGEKMGYSLTVLLTYMVLLTLVADSLPPISTEISVLQIYLTGVICLGTVATLLTVWTVTLYNQKPSKSRPDWLIKLVTKYLRPLLCQSCDRKSKYDTFRSQGGDGEGDMSQRFGRSQGHEMNESPMAEFQNPNHVTVDDQRGEKSRSQVSLHSESAVRNDNRNKHFNYEDLSNKKQEKQNSKNRLGLESKARDKRTPTEKAKSETDQDNYSESTHEDKEVTWVEVAELMDVFCFSELSP